MQCKKFSTKAATGDEIITLAEAIWCVLTKCGIITKLPGKIVAKCLSKPCLAVLIESNPILLKMRENLLRKYSVRFKRKLSFIQIVIYNFCFSEWVCNWLLNFYLLLFWIFLNCHEARSNQWYSFTRFESGSSFRVRGRNVLLLFEATIIFWD